MSSSASSSDPFELRITNHGKIRNFVAFALKFIKDNPSRPLVLHTLPVASSAKEDGQDEMIIIDEQLHENGWDDEEQQRISGSEHSAKKQKLHSSTAAIPKLVTVVEIAKREYIKWAKEQRRIDRNHVAPADGRLGLHQYNQLETLQSLGLLPNNKLLEPNLAKALSGRNHLKQEHTPHLRVTLTANALPDLEKTYGTTYQPPPILVKSKSARVREKKKERKAKQAASSNQAS